jgi:flavin-dependent dehydrogenase
MYVASWMFPKQQDIINAGAGIILKNQKNETLNLKTAFKTYMGNLGVALEGEPSFSGNYVTSGPIHRTYSDRLLVCGDSAGQVFPGFGEGIYFALKAGQLAGRTAIKAIYNDTYNTELLKEYETDWKTSFGKQMDAGLIFATIMFYAMRHKSVPKMHRILTPEEIKDISFYGTVSFKLRFFYSMLRAFGCSVRR